MASENNRRVAKNAVALTIRMALVTVVGLYTSRIVLEALGVDDYGIYGVIGGVVAMASFLNTSMAGATSRFITYEMGTGNHEKLRRIFSTALIIHFIIAGIVAVLAETVGLWFVNTKMNFPPGSMFAVNVLYQFTILSMIVSFTQVPYTATILAHERMSIYAWLEIVNVVLKLVIVYLLLLVSSNRLILYSGLTALVSVVLALTYRIYCLRNFEESKFTWIWDKSLLYEMLKFSGYNMYGRACMVVRDQVQPILLNIFFGVVANVAASIALTVSGAINGFASAVTQAFSPQITKNYASHNIEQMALAMRRAAQFNLLAFAAISVPFYIMTPQILFLWLGQVPIYSVEFTRLVLLVEVSQILINVNYIGITATGDVRRMSFINGSVYLLIPIFSYLALKIGILNPTIVYWVSIILLIVVVVLSFWYVKIQIEGFNVSSYVWFVVRALVAIGLAIPITFIVFPVCDNDISSTWIGTLSDVVIVTLIYNFSLLIFSYFISMSREEKEFVNYKIRVLCERIRISSKR